MKWYTKLFIAAFLLVGISGCTLYGMIILSGDSNFLHNAR